MLGTLGIFWDITDKKKAQIALAESEKKYRTLFENGLDLICVHDLHGTIIDTNMPFKREYGWKVHDLIGSNLRELLPHEQRTKFDVYLKRILQN